MADISDVETNIAGIVTDMVYPNGTSAPSITGSIVRIYRGWPNQAALNADLASGIVHITIFPDPGRTRISTRYLDPPEATSVMLPTMTASVTASTATFSGVAAPGQIAGILVDNSAFVHRTVKGDTPEFVAGILGTYIRTRRAVQVRGASLTLPGSGSLIARVVADQTTRGETRRQVQSFRLSFWCPTPTLRDQIAALADVTLSTRKFLTLPDATAARLQTTSVMVFDQSQNAGLYRRDQMLSVEYATTTATVQPALIFGDARLLPNASTGRSLLG